MAVATYYAPKSIKDMVYRLSFNDSLGIESRILAGGTDLIIQMKNAVLEPECIVDIKKVPEATRIAIEEDCVYLGAAVPAHQITENETLKSLFPGLVESVEYIGSSQIQSRATVGGNLSNASPAGDTIPALVVNDAECVIWGPSGERRIPVTKYVTGVQTNCLQSDEFLLALSFKLPSARSSDAYIRFTPRTEMDIAVVGAAARLRLDQRNRCVAAELALGAIDTRVISTRDIADLLIGSTLDEATLQQAGQLAEQAGNPIDDKRGTLKFRKRVAGVLLKRAIERARDRIYDLN